METLTFIIQYPNRPQEVIRATRNEFNRIAKGYHHIATINENRTIKQGQTVVQPDRDDQDTIEQGCRVRETINQEEMR